MSSGEQIRDFTPAGFVASEFVKELALNDGQHQCEIRNVGTGISRTLLDFAQECWANWGASGSLNIGVVPPREECALCQNYRF